MERSGVEQNEIEEIEEAILECARTFEVLLLTPVCLALERIGLSWWLGQLWVVLSHLLRSV